MIEIRLAIEDDIAAIKAIADDNKQELGFVSRGMLRSAIARGGLIVAVIDNVVAGYCELWRRRDGQTTIYSIAVADNPRHKGVGRALIDYLIAERRRCISLLCTLDNP